MHIVIAGGGTGGHVQPAVAVVDELRRRGITQISWIGSHAGIEKDVAPSIGVPFYPIATGKLRRYLSLQTPLDAARIPLGVLQARRHLFRLKPDVVFSTGGFVSVPTVVAAWAARIPSLSHEQTAVSGLANRINARFCDVIAVSYPSSAPPLEGHRARIVVTGNPVRPSILDGDADPGLRFLGFSNDTPIIYVTGGSLGAHAINEIVRTLISELVSRYQVVHQCGPVDANGDLPRLQAARSKLPQHLQARYFVAERFDAELPDILAASELVIGRAGASTVAELAALGKPSILIPLPGAGGDEQTHNASVLASAGGAALLPQRDLSRNRLLREIDAILENPETRASMADGARGVYRADATARLADEIMTLGRQRR
jgi:UDP-N-acetylglucosamine--N-acetylmuramyl-(pentapeptide) pyrophosphoryl-undecaprenol N-acetylglucosamine transferase